MPRPIKAVINKKALAHNLSILKKKAQNRFFWSVVKANAYGHGLLNLLDVFEGYADGLALLEPKCAVQVRQAGWKKPVLLIEGFFDPTDLPILEQYELETLVHNERQIRWLTEYSFSKKIRVHVKCNTGMNRLGFRPDQIAEVIKRLEEIPNIEVVDILAHFANSEISYPMDQRVSVEKQLKNLDVLRGLKPMCLSNTGAILWHPQASDAAVRAGIAMYGVSPDASISNAELEIRPVMTLESEIMAFQDMQVGEACGYGSTFVATRPTKLAVVACGYADGYPRAKSGERYALVRGQKAPIIGNVSMDMLTIDVTDIKAVALSDKVVFWGEELPVNEVASWFSTIGYELLCDVNERVPRIYLE